jgi:hypothetical protein
MAQLYSFKISGRTAASTDGTATGIIATLAVSYDSDGFLRFTDTEGNVHAIPMTLEVAELMKVIFTGTGGIDAGSSGVQGHRPFGVPALAQ